MNELKSEKSPYLLQHKLNPVWWKAWNDKTLELVKRSKKPVLVSIGYSTCHWCHVMERESFEDEQVAKALNDGFVAIKVDREELPEVDQIYMSALQAMGQRGGWPLNVFLTPELKPFYGGTYFPKDYFLQLLKHLSQAWQSEPEKIQQNATILTDALREQNKVYDERTSWSSEFLDCAAEVALRDFDRIDGGFGEAPKFPPQSQIYFLARHFTISGNKMLPEIMMSTLDHMAAGGIYDHVGGGFTRYSVDVKWQIPHFEKMLYVNAQAATNYLELYQLTGKDDYLLVAKDVLGYMSRDLLSAKSGFFSAEDADSESKSGNAIEEGAFYLWTIDELKALLTKEEFDFIYENFDVTKVGNFEGQNHLALKTQNFAQVYTNPLFQDARMKLYEAREVRPRPLLDDKQLTSWNALAISSFCLAYRVTLEKSYLETAKQVAQFINSTLYKNGVLCRRYRDGDVRYNGLLEDYAYLTAAVLDLYQCDADEKWLNWAMALQKKVDAEFESSNQSGYYSSPSGSKNLILRMKDFGDNALPSAEAVAISNLNRLAVLTSNTEFNKRAEAHLTSGLSMARQYPMSFSRLLAAALELEKVNYQTLEVPIAAYSETLKKLSVHFLPFLILKPSKSDKYVLCSGSLCHPPTSNWAEVESVLLTLSAKRHLV